MQHVCSVIIFIVCFVGIFQERVSPITVVSWGTVGTVLGWSLWDFWVDRDEKAMTVHSPRLQHEVPIDEHSGASSTSSNCGKQAEDMNPSLGVISRATNPFPHSHSASTSSINSSNASPLTTHHYTSTSLCPRNRRRLSTLKSALLILSALLGLSPILKSLTLSTSSDSIWAMSCWLLAINVFFFDYGGDARPLNSNRTPGTVGANTSGTKFPASLSTNAALMASTVLASRLPSTEHVFSLTLFSIEVFGLFPVFRRHLRGISWRGHLLLTCALVVCAGGGVGIVVSGTRGEDGTWLPGGWGWGNAGAAVVGVTVGNIVTCLAMGGCSWWLIGLQRFKNEIHGPWDPARPIIRREWGDYQ